MIDDDELRMGCPVVYMIANAVPQIVVYAAPAVCDCTVNLILNRWSPLNECVCYTNACHLPLCSFKFNMNLYVFSAITLNKCMYVLVIMYVVCHFSKKIFDLITFIYRYFADYKTKVSEV